MKLKKMLIALSILCLGIITSISAQNCQAYFPIDEGTVLETNSFNAKGKLQSINTQKLVSKAEKDGGLELKVHSTSTDAKGKNKTEADLTFICKGNNFYIDMNSFVSPEQKESFKGMEMEIVTNNLEIPSTMSPGMKLKDGSVDMKMKADSPINLSFSTSIINRKVEAIESVTTPAGTFECYKISQDIVTKSAFFTISMRSIDWYAKNVGSVKNEAYDSKNNKVSYQELVAIKK